MNLNQKSYFNNYHYFYLLTPTGLCCYSSVVCFRLESKFDL